MPIDRSPEISPLARCFLPCDRTGLAGRQVPVKTRTRSSTNDGNKVTILCDACGRVATEFEFLPDAAFEAEPPPDLTDSVGLLKSLGPFSKLETSVAAYQVGPLLEALAKRSARDLFVISREFARCYCPFCNKALCSDHALVREDCGLVEAVCHRCHKDRPLSAFIGLMEDRHTSELLRMGGDPFEHRRQWLNRLQGQRVEQPAGRRPISTRSAETLKKKPKGAEKRRQRKQP